MSDPNNPDQVMWVHNPLQYKDIQQLKEAVTAYGLHAPFTLPIFESFGALNLMPQDWRSKCQEHCTQMSGSSQHHGWVPWEKCWHAYWGQSVCRKCWSNLQGCAERYRGSAHHSVSETDAKRSEILPQQRPREEITRGSSTCGWKDSHYMPAWKSCGTWAFLAGATAEQPLIIPPIPIS